MATPTAGKVAKLDEKGHEGKILYQMSNGNKKHLNKSTGKYKKDRQQLTLGTIED